MNQPSNRLILPQIFMSCLIIDVNYTVGPTFTVLINTEVAHDLILSLQKKKKIEHHRTFVKPYGDEKN